MAKTVDAVSLLIQAGKTDTIYRDVYLRRARELLSPTLDEPGYRAIGSMQKDLDELVRHTRSAVVQFNWDEAAELSAQADRMRKAIDARAGIFQAAAAKRLAANLIMQNLSHELSQSHGRIVEVATLNPQAENNLAIENHIGRWAELQSLVDFPPAPKLTVLGKLDRKKASESELRGQELFFAKAQCSVCHPGPYYTDNSMHNLKTERFYKPVTVLGRTASADGPIKTFPLRGIKDSPPYLHDGRLPTLEDTVEFFNLVLETKLTAEEKKDLVAFLKCL